jgi:hypothetical protein
MVRSAHVPVVPQWYHDAVACVTTFYWYLRARVRTRVRTNVPFGTHHGTYHGTMVQWYGPWYHGTLVRTYVPWYVLYVYYVPMVLYHVHM